MLWEDVREEVRASGLLGGGEPVVAMLSGGRDSTCLLDVLVELRGARAVSALHVNYGLRPQAGEEELHCAELCVRLGVALEVVRAGPPPRGAGPAPGTGPAPGAGAAPPDAAAAGGATPGGAPGQAAGNLQAWARELRYRAGEELARPAGALLATGHTASDQVETILYRLAASPGRRALLGMAPAEGRLVRPLLGITRAQTAAYCSERGLPWREDESNADERFARARVRHGLLPELRAVHPAAESNVIRTARLLREETELLDALVGAELADAAAGGGVSIVRLAELPAALARMVVVRLAEDAAGTYVPQAGDRVRELIELGRRGGRAELHVGGGAGAVIEDGLLTMVRLPPRG